MKYTTTSSNNTTGNSSNSSATNASTALFCEQVNTVTNLFERWNDCERTVVMYALLKRLRYPSLKFLQYSIDSNLTQNLGSQSNLSSVVIDINANNASYLQNLINVYKTFHLVDATDALSSSSSDKDSMPCYGSDFQLTQCDDRKLYGKKEDILHEVLGMLPLLKPGNEEAKLIYLSLIPIAVKDTMRQIVPTELVQQIFSYLLIHPAISSDDRRSLNVWLRHLEEHIQSSSYAAIGQQQSFFTEQQQQQLPQQQTTVGSISCNSNTDNTTMISSGSSTSSSSSSSSSASCSSASTASVSSSIGSIASSRNADWQTIAPPSKHHQHLQQQHHQQQQQQQQVQLQMQQLHPKSLHDWSSVVAGQSLGAGVVGVGGSVADTLCDNLNGITLNELASSQNSLGLTIGGGGGHHTAAIFSESSLVNGVVAAAAVSQHTAPSLFGTNTHPIINIINNNNNSCTSNLNNDDHDTSFSKNGTEILDFEPTPSNPLGSCDSCISSNPIPSGQQQQLSQRELPPPQQQMGYASILINNCDQLDINRWSLDSKLASLKTRRSNSLTTQTISSSSSSSNSSVITVNDNCSNSTENLAQFANKPRSFSLSIEHSRGALTTSGSDTRLDEFKPNYIKFQTRNLGMSNIGIWLKSLRLHKYIELFKNMTYEEMLQISEEFLQSLGVTKGASHKLALCIEKLKERNNHLTKLEQDLLTGQLKLQSAVEELTHIVLTPMKPIEAVNAAAGEENVALKFLKVLDLVCSIVQKDTYAAQDEENASVLFWILERTIYNEAFVNHVNQLKELKFKLSKLKMSLAPKMHHVKNNSNNGNLNKPRWNGKTRKCDNKNGSNDRINLRKNSNDMLNFSLSCLQQQHLHTNSQQQTNEYDKYHHISSGVSNNSSNGGGNNQHQYKSSSYPNFVNTQQHQQQMKQHHHQQQQQQQQQQQIQQQMLQQHAHFPALPQQQQITQQQQQQQHRRSLNNLIVVSNSAQQPQKVVFKPGQAVLTATATTSADNLQLENAIKNQQRKTSLTTSATYTPPQSTTTITTNTEVTSQQQQHQQQQPKKTMAAVVMVSSDELAAVAATQQQQQQQPPQLLININSNNNNNNNILNNNLICHQQQQQQHLLQQQQLQLLAAAAAAVGNLNSSNSSCSNNNNCSNSSSNCNDCSSLSVVATAVNNQMCNQLQSPIIANLNLPPKEFYHAAATANAGAVAAAAAMNDIKSLEQLETLCLQMTEQAIN